MIVCGDLHDCIDIIPISSYRAPDVCHHPHTVFISLWNEARKRSRWPGNHRCVVSELHVAVPLPVGPFHLPGGRLHSSDWLHGLEGHSRLAAGQWPLDLDQAVRLPGRCALHGIWSHYCRQQVLLPCAPFASHHHGHLLRCPDAHSAVGRRVPRCGGVQEENMRWNSLYRASWTHLTAKPPTLCLHLSVVPPHQCYHGNWSTTWLSPYCHVSMVVSHVYLIRRHGSIIYQSYLPSPYLERLSLNQLPWQRVWKY